MKRLSFVFSSVLAILLISIAFAYADEQDLLRSLEKIKAKIEIGVSYNEYLDLLADCKAEFAIYKRSSKSNKCFLKNAEGVVGRYQVAGEVWETNNNAKKALLKWENNPYVDVNETRFKEIIQSSEDTRQKCWDYANDDLDKAYKCLK